MQTKNRFVPKIGNEETAALPAVEFGGAICVVDREEQVEAACEELMRQPMIGFDTETRPSFRPGVMYRVALLQLSAPERCYLFRLNRIALSKPLLQLLESPEVLKIGADVAPLPRRRIRRPADAGAGVGDRGEEPAQAVGHRPRKTGLEGPAAEQLGGGDAHAQTAALCRDGRVGLHGDLPPAAGYAQSGGSGRSGAGRRVGRKRSAGRRRALRSGGSCPQRTPCVAPKTVGCRPEAVADA